MNEEMEKVTEAALQAGYNATAEKFREKLSGEPGIMVIAGFANAVEKQTDLAALETMAISNLTGPGLVATALHVASSGVARLTPEQAAKLSVMAANLAGELLNQGSVIVKPIGSDEEGAGHA